MISGQVPVRQMQVHDTWAVRDLPVLDATIGLLEHSYMVTVTDIAAKTAFDPSVVAQALEALNPVYVDFRKTTTGGDPRFWYVFKVTPEARRVVGQWPTAEALVSRIVEELSVAARQEDNAENQGLLAYAARLIGDTLRDETVRAAGAVLAPAFGGVPIPEVGQQVPPPGSRPEVEFESLVPLPELPEFLRPRADSVESTAPVTAQPDPARSATEPSAPQTSAPEPSAPEPSAPRASAPEPSAPEPSAPRASAPEPPEESVPEESMPEASGPERVLPGGSMPEPLWQAKKQAATSPGPSADVPDLNPWPDRPGAADAPSATVNRTPLTEPTPFRSSSSGTWPAADGDPGTADTDQDLVQLRQDAV